MFRVTLFNQHAACGISATGRYPLAAYRRAIIKAGPDFLNHGRASFITWASLWNDARAGWKRYYRNSSVHVAQGGFGIELRRLG